MADDFDWGMTLSEGFLPDELIKLILDNFPTLTGVSTLPSHVCVFAPMANHLEALCEVVRELQEEFEDLRATKKASAAQLRVERRERKKCEVQEDEELAIDGVTPGIRGTEGSTELASEPVRSAGRIRIPGGRFSVQSSLP